MKKAKKAAPRTRAAPKRRKSSVAAPAPSADIDIAQPQIGRPRKLVCNADTIKKITSMAMAQCSQKEAAYFLGVMPNTFRDFLNQNPPAKEAWEMGPDAGRAALRRVQLATALRGNVQMQKWLGSNWLGQRIKVDGRIAGPGGGPLRSITQEGPPVEGQDLAALYAEAIRGGP